MGTQHSELGLYDLRDLWNYVPAGGEIVVTREKITVSNSPTLEIKRRVLLHDLKPGDMLVNLPRNMYSDDYDPDLTPATSLDRPISPIDVTPLPIRSNRTRYGSMRSTYGSIDEGRHMTPKHSKVSSLILLNPGQFPSEGDLHYPDLGFGGEDTIPEPGFTPSMEKLDYLERMPTTLFRTRSSLSKDKMTLQRIFAKNPDEAEGQGRHWERLLEQKSVNLLDADIDEHEEVKCVETSDLMYNPSPLATNPITTDKGVVLLKKLATQFEQKGKLECHVYFTPRTSAEIWPHLIVMVDETWHFIKVMRKALAEMQRKINIGDRDGTHDWIFDYHPNREVSKIRKDLKILFGPRALRFRDSNLKKIIKESTSDFVNKMWILQKSSVSDKHRRGRSRGAGSKSRKNRASSEPSTGRTRSISVDRPKGYPRRFQRDGSFGTKNVQ